ncbi:MAG: sigma-70 family RNA polymerase sigma factor [Candidatus Aminicenantes bacterium]
MKNHNSYDLKKITSKYRPIVTFKVKKSIGSHTPEWEDIVNEIMLNTIEKIKSGEFKGESSVGTFIYTITRRRIVDYIRRKKRRAHKYIPESDPFPDPHEQIENKERAEMLAKKLEELKPKYKTILYLYYYKDLSRREVAQRLGISPRKVSERVHYAQKLLRNLIKK